MTKIPFALKPANPAPKVVSAGKHRAAPSTNPATITKVRSTQRVGRQGGRPS